jgi:hypothetical protein
MLLLACWKHWIDPYWKGECACTHINNANCTKKGQILNLYYLKLCMGLVDIGFIKLLLVDYKQLKDKLLLV